MPSTMPLTVSVGCPPGTVQDDNADNRDSGGADWEQRHHPPSLHLCPRWYIPHQVAYPAAGQHLLDRGPLKLSPPTLVADPGLGDRPVINGYDDHRGEGSSTKNFYIAVRNLNIDTTGVASNVGARAINWSVSQGCSLTNVHITMPSSSEHTGITMDMGGSGKIISDCSFTGGAVGLRLASQQYMLKGLRFDGCGVGILVQTSQVSTIQGCSFANCKYGVDMGAEDSSGALSIVDSSVSGCSAGVNTHVSGNGQGSLVLDNFAVSDAVAVRSSNGSTLLQGSVPDGQVWVMGNT
jgi:glucan 1,3-beta-glucosidase